MGHYKSNLRDLEFNLFEFLGRQDILGSGPFAEVDEETARTILSEADRLAREELAASFEDADRDPPTFDPQTGSVSVPRSLHDSYRAFMDAEWYRLDLPVELGGVGAPKSLRWAAAELLLGANPALFMYVSGASFANVLSHIGTERQRRLAQQTVDNHWGATMVLTEPDAGSDVGAGRASAKQQPDGTWHIEGVKRFITAGEHDLAENIIHLVLARPEGARAGTKGLSLFVVPKQLVTEDGSLGERNGVYAANVEDKMGLKASATCELRFGESRPATGYLVGDVHDGIRQMFLIIEHARMMVGAKGIATLSTGYLNALEYAKERVQGADLTRMADKTAPRVTIAHHPDVRRMLMTQKAYAEGMRALLLFTASVQDDVQLADASGQPDEDAERLNDLLLPIVKGMGSERSYELLSQSLQTMGGSGYLQDYPIEQYIRDAKIDTLYEGTTAIQGMDLFFRKIAKDEGRALSRLADEITAFADSDAGNGRLKEERGLLATALEDVQALVAAMIGYLTSAGEQPQEIYKVGLNGNRLLQALGDVVVGWLLLRQAEVAMNKLDAAGERGFYEGKVAAARFFATTVLPRLAVERRLAETTTTDLMELPEEAF